jgi:hypothetical protein
MKRSLLAVFATLALALGWSASASAATANLNASCVGKIGSSLAGLPGDRAEIAHIVKVEAQDKGLPPGAFQSEVAHRHQPLAGC